jgi:hypothetical protein
VYFELNHTAFNDPQTLKEFITMVTIPQGLEERIHNCSFASEGEIAEVVSVVDELCAFIQHLKCVPLLSLLASFSSTDILASFAPGARR